METRLLPSVQALKTAGKWILLEAGWLLGCIALGSLGCWSEYGCSTVAFFAVTLYALTGIIRLFLYCYVRWLSR